MALKSKIEGRKKTLFGKF